MQVSSNSRWNVSATFWSGTAAIDGVVAVVITGSSVAADCRTGRLAFLSTATSPDYVNRMVSRAFSKRLLCHMQWRPLSKKLCINVGDRLTDRQTLSLLIALWPLGMWWSQPISASVGCGSVGCRFHVQNPSDSDMDTDLSRDQNYQLLWLL